MFPALHLPECFWRLGTRYSISYIQCALQIENLFFSSKYYRFENKCFIPASLNPIIQPRLVALVLEKLTSGFRRKNSLTFSEKLVRKHYTAVIRNDQGSCPTLLETAFRKCSVLSVQAF